MASQTGIAVQEPNSVNLTKPERLRVAIVQSRLAPFRAVFFNRLAERLELTILCGERSIEGESAKPKEPIRFRLRVLTTWLLGKGRVCIHPWLPFAILGGGFDVVVAEARLGAVMNPFVLLFSRLTGKRFLWWTCGYEPHETQAISRFKRSVREFLFRSAHGGIAYSRQARHYFAERGLSPDRIWIAHNSLDTEALLALEREILHDPGRLPKLRKQYQAENKLIVLFVGRLIGVKRVDDLLHAFRIVEQSSPDAVLWIVGGGPDKEPLEELARSMDLKQVHFLGEISEPLVINAIYMAADMFALPGTGGLAINQAMTFGKPVVVSSADGTEEDLVTDGHNGLYFKPGDANDLAAKILHLLRDPELRNTMGCRSREIIQTRVNMTKMVASFCDAILNRRSETT